jgi:hypothetical protein
VVVVVVVEETEAAAGTRRRHRHPRRAGGRPSRDSKQRPRRLRLEMGMMGKGTGDRLHHQ